MMIIIYFFFMIPLFFNFQVYYYYQFFFIVVFCLSLKYNFYNFFCFFGYNLGLDNYSFFLIILCILICCFMLMSVNYLIGLNFFVFLVYFLCFVLIFIFCFLNILIFYFFFEFSLIPLIILIFGWGYQVERLYSGFYLFFYTLFASLPLFVLIIYFYLNFYTLFFGSFYFCMNNFFFHFFMVFSFLVKFPMFMFHFWLPKAHVQAPVFGSMILAGLVLKVGGYGFIRFLNLFDYMFFFYNYVWFSLSLYGCLIVGLVCFIQGDIKCLIAYSSISHMGLCLIGFLSLFNYGVFGSYLMMISHGFCSSGLFYVSNLIYLRSFSRSFFLNKGMINLLPGLSLMWFFLCLFNMSCPPSINFFSEIFILYGMMKYWSFSLYFFVFISFFSSCFSFFLYSYVQHGQFSMIYSFYLVTLNEYLLMFLHISLVILFIFIFPYF
uniref:NADH dehydrogenase subunit 4 n=1 Tax=Krisna quadrimaculosus TaxID=3041591 RepID=UPI002551DA2E|nr:NADH dehydrogenase subunit 4 [Krisna quadrimaculosus]WGG89454.1 NADH dehydrogenase subunit 4 [Krisna quadrimaculosus]